MTTLAQIEQAVMTLTQDDFQKLYQWMRERDHQQWDQQIEEDSHNGALDWLANQAIREFIPNNRVSADFLFACVGQF